MKLFRIFSIFVLVTFIAPPFSFSQNTAFIRYQSPEVLNYPELVILGKNPNPGGSIGKKVEKLFHTPIVSNEAFYTGYKPRRPQQSDLGPVLRLASWNVENALSVDKLISIFSSPVRFERMIDTNAYPVGSQKYQDALAQRTLLHTSDVIVLQEMDIGMKRSGYRNSVKELANALNMNYAFATEQIEVDPVNLGLVEEFMYEDGKVEERLHRAFQVDPDKYMGLCGLAVLSRYPVKHVEVRPLQYQPYDWYYDEAGRYPVFKKVPRENAREEFLDKVMREIKISKRLFFRVDLEVPEYPNGTLSVINVQLEQKCTAHEREIQLREILSYIREIDNPVVLAGNFNSAAGDLSSLSVKSEIKRAATDPSILITPAISWLIPGGAFISAGRLAARMSDNLQNPSDYNIPLFMPNRTKGMFDELEFFRFKDGTAFDFRGNMKRSANGKNRPLSNSNERDGIGYKMTYDTYSSFFNVAGKYRLDWIFVKPGTLANPFDYSAGYRFAPHYGMTLEELNTSLRCKISDHHPNVVDLPLEEPSIQDPDSRKSRKIEKRAGMKFRHLSNKKY